MAMATHAASTGTLAPPQLGGRRRYRPPHLGARMIITIALIIVTLAVATWSAGAQRIATAVCTTGAPAGATCGEALVLLGYP